MIARVVHLTSVHPRFDTRIFLKECTSLAQNGFHVTLVVADGEGDEHKNGVNVVDVGVFGGRINRMLHAPGRIFQKALALDADIYHLHDPELLLIGLKLKKIGKKVIFDAHEDVPKQILGKPYLNRVTKVLLSWGVRHFEAWACGQFDAIVTATPFIRDKFLSINPRSLDINNFPLLGELSFDVRSAEKLPQVCYVGGIAAIRGVREMVAAMGLLSLRV